MQDSKKIQNQQDFIDKLTGNAKYQGNWRKISRTILTNSRFKNIDCTKQKKNKFII